MFCDGRRADGGLMKQIAADPDFAKRHPGFPKRAYAYRTIADTWVDAGPLPEKSCDHAGREMGEGHHCG